jgi:hypothetical protein
VVGEKPVNQNDFGSARDNSDAREFVNGTTVLVPGEEFLVRLRRLGNILLRLLEDGKETRGGKREDWSCCQKQTKGIHVELHFRLSSAFVWGRLRGGPQREGKWYL